MLITEKMDKLLKPSSVEFILYSKMNPTMSMLGMFNKQDLHGDKHFAFATDRTSAEDDILNGILHEPVEMEEASQLPQIEISGIQEESGHTTKLGFGCSSPKKRLRTTRTIPMSKELLKERAM